MNKYLIPSYLTIVNYDFKNKEIISFRVIQKTLNIQNVDDSNYYINYYSFMIHDLFSISFIIRYVNLQNKKESLYFSNPCIKKILGENINWLTTIILSTINYQILDRSYLNNRDSKRTYVKHFKKNKKKYNSLIILLISTYNNYYSSKLISYTPKNIENTGCSICLDDCLSNMIQISCNHYFHRQCIRQWLNKCGTCPLCRHTSVINLSYEDSIIVIFRNVLNWNRSSKKRVYNLIIKQNKTFTEKIITYYKKKQSNNNTNYLEKIGKLNCIKRSKRNYDY